MAWVESFYGRRRVERSRGKGKLAGSTDARRRDATTDLPARSHVADEMEIYRQPSGCLAGAPSNGV